MSLELRIKQARKKGGFSQKILAEKLAITGRTLQRYEKDASKMPIEIMKGISFLCAADLGWLLTGEGQMQEKEDAAPGSVKGANVGRVILHRKKTPYIPGRLLPKKKDPFYELLEEIITAIEQYLSINNLELSPSKKAELVVILCEQFQMADSGFELDTFERFMRLAVKE
jgi:transcriptional regulator with XRE-family HTH domain